MEFSHMLSGTAFLEQCSSFQPFLNRSAGPKDIPTIHIKMIMQRGSQSGAPVKNPWAVVPSGFLRRSHLATDEHRGCCGAGLLGTVVLWDQYRPGPSPRFSSASGAVFILPGTGGVRARAGVGLALCWSLPWARNPDHPSASMSCCPWSRCPGPVAGSSAH